MDVREIQERLTAKGYDCGEIDGIMGPITEAAIKAFQEVHDLDADGIVGPLTEAALMEDPLE